MTAAEAKTIETAAVILLHAVKADVTDNDVKAALKFLPVHADYRDRVSLATAKAILESLPAWHAGKE
jgi:hypothetical protein